MKNTNIRKILYHIKHRYVTMNNVVMAVALVIGAGWAWASVGVMQRNFGLQKELDAKQRELKLAELETQNLTFEQKYYKSTEYQELAVRERLGLVSPGEKVLLLPPNTPAAKEADAKLQTKTPTAPTTQPEANFQQWANFLLGDRK